MPDWHVMPETVTTTGQPRQYFSKTGEMFIIAAERFGGGNDSVLPRRVIGMGATRASARRSLDETLGTYDSSYRVLPSR